MPNELITILIPCYNEEQSLPALYKALCTTVEAITPPCNRGIFL